jgi:hypothetical protein
MRTLTVSYERANMTKLPSLLPLSSEGQAVGGRANIVDLDGDRVTDTVA